MKLLYSVNEVPYIQFENGARLIFSKSTESDRGFKYLAFSGVDITSIVVSGAKAKKVRRFRSSSHVSSVLDTNLKSPGKSSVPKALRNIGFTKLVESYLRKMFEPLIDEDGYFPRENLPTLQGILDRDYENDEDTWDNDPTATEDFDDD